MKNKKNIHWLNIFWQFQFFLFFILNPLFNLCDKVHHLSHGNFQKTYLPTEFTELDSQIFDDLRKNAENKIQEFL